MRQKIAIVFPGYDVRVHKDKDPGILFSMLQQDFDVHMICTGEGRAEENCITMSWGDIFEANWMAQYPHDVYILFHPLKQHYAIIQQAKSAGAKTIIKADSDGYQARLTLNPFSPAFAVQKKFSGRPFPFLKYWARMLVINHWAKRRGFFDVDYIIVESSQAYKSFAKALPSIRDKFVMIPNGGFFTSDPQDLLDKKNVICSVGNWKEQIQKNPDLLFKAIPVVLKENPDWSFVIIGAMEENIQLLYNNLSNHMKERVRLLGPVPHSEVLRYMRTSKILLSTSRWESFGLVAVEALGQGCSIVCTPTGMSMQTADGVLGLTTDSWNPQEVANTLFWEINLWEKSLRKPEEIVAVARNYFDWSIIIGKIKKLILC
ncbi:MAG TPA: glycosyltransferase [Methylomusa anaerophila]|uniref:D-inositol 3-phosphate glycosyltransferase n=1 Tax=Methylomusa anaerophila TaxID=1930071 RepID=A0A348AKL6_9FIRM|nr:glycosyltransferase [Methylomusa anaerophila]BBB91614.1 D-inositol 3-phosphate glycosyltransferase [Methylomusa anaerophila]HML89448.1 glycosyltransferase [Methylomusa anaerophila]